MRLEAQFLRFAAAGLAGTAVLYGVLWIGVSTLSAPAALASAVGYALGSVLSYLLNYFFTFHSDQMHRIAVPRYVAVFGAGWCINTGLMTLFVHHWSWNLWWAQALTTGIGLVWTFAGSRAWTFK